MYYKNIVQKYYTFYVSVAILFTLYHVLIFNGVCAYIFMSLFTIMHVYHRKLLYGKRLSMLDTFSLDYKCVFNSI